jgi:prepilin-type N-terminal cleavage/methylation domain-containing protein
MPYPKMFLRDNSHHPRGYTLLEMVIVMLTLGIVASVAIPRYTASLNRYRTQVAVQRLAQDIELCRRHARFTSQNVTLTVSFAKSFYRLSSVDSPLRPGNPYEVIVGDGASVGAICPVVDGIVSSASRTLSPDLNIVFDRYGNPTQSAEIGIQYGNATGIVRLSLEGVVTRS